MIAAAWKQQTQAVHTGTGFTLRRFNTDITKGESHGQM